MTSVSGDADMSSGSSSGGSREKHLGGGGGGGGDGTLGPHRSLKIFDVLYS